MARRWLPAGLVLVLAGCGMLGGDEPSEGEGEGQGAPPAEAAPPPLPDAPPISAGEDHTCAVRPTGELFCWGRNLDGELGDGTSRNRRVPVPVRDLAQVHQVSAGRYHTCALRRDGNVFCWGRNDHGQLGDGSTENRAAPVQVAGIADAVQVGAGHELSCALLRAGTVTCWGNGQSGRLGRGSTQSSPTPVPVEGVTGATRIAVGGWHACALVEGGRLWCWGADDNGQLGLPGDAPREQLSPQPVPGLEGVTAVAAGHLATCAVHGGNLSCWGDAYYGLLGNGQSGSGAADGQTPALVAGLAEVADVDVGVYQACARLGDGTVRCWGNDGYGNLGAAERGHQVTPAEVSGLSDATHLAVGAYHVCVRRASGAIACWGKSGDGQLGAHEIQDAYHAIDRIASLAELTADAPPVHTFAPAAAPPPTAPMVSTSDGYACGVRSDGRVLCWGGAASSGQLGNGGARPATSGAVEVAGITDAVEVRTSQSAACARRQSGEVACWGYLGRVDGSPDHVRTSRPIPLPGVTDAIGIALSTSGPCVLHRAGTVSCAAATALEPVEGLTGAVEIVAGGTSACARLEGGGVRCWGSGNRGQLGNGADQSSRTPVEVAGLTDAEQLSASFSYTCALRRGGAISCWGSNEKGQLGNGRSGEGAYENRPVAVRGVRGAVEVAAGVHHACARFADHSLRCWGANDADQLGTGQERSERTPAIVASPVAVAAPEAPLGPIAQLSCGWHHCCTVHENGQLQCWGRSSVLGEGTLGGLVSSRSNRPRAITLAALGSAPPPAPPAPPAEPAPEPAPVVAVERVEVPPEAASPEEPAAPDAREPRAGDPRSAVEQAVHQASRTCYGRLGARGRVTVRVTVGPDGRVQTSRVISNGTGNDETGRCISGALVGRRFSRPRQGAVTYDIAFGG
ncbi:MAG: hypothetical protein KF729_32625 [Sandaracinaceae bacterium]|nr:hypothetical protein [Sandaracinaceae bacterium]